MSSPTLTASPTTEKRLHRLRNLCEPFTLTRCVVVSNQSRALAIEINDGNGGWINDERLEVIEFHLEQMSDHRLDNIAMADKKVVT